MLVVGSNCMLSPRTKSTLIILSAALLTYTLHSLIVQQPAVALPNIAMEYGQSCFLCHVDPSGGGPRSLYGGQFMARNELPTYPNSFQEIDNFNPQINQWLTLGADLRILHNNVESTPVSGSQIMQGAVHLTAQLHPKWSLYISKDWNRDYQAAGIAHILPLDGYIKIGRFAPPFGLRPDDHTMYIRDALFGSPIFSDVGWEIGFHPQNWEFTAALMNGSSGTANDNRAYAMYVRSAYRLNFNKIKIMLGGSAFGDDLSNGDFEQLWYGPFYGVNIGPLSLIGEIDFTEDLPVSFSSGSPSENPIGIVTSHLAYYELLQGCFLRAGYDFQDDDIDWKSGVAQRYTVGVQWFPYGFLEIQGNFRFEETEDADGNTTDRISFDGQIHLFF